MRFSDSFWNEDMCSCSGLDILCKHMRDGKQTLRDYADFIKSWAQAHEIFGKSLIKLSKSVVNKLDDTDSLRESWDMLKLKTENVGCMNVAVASSLMEEVHSTLEFMENQREQRKRTEDGVRKTHANKKNIHKKTSEHKKLYHAKCKEYESCEQMCEDMAQNLSAKELEKLQVKCAKLKTQCNVADSQYKSTVKSLNKIRICWEKEMEAACEIFQELEMSRMKYLRNAYWISTNIGSGLSVALDEVFEQIRKKIECCNLDEDIQNFIKKSRTGSKRPDAVHYEVYEGQHRSNAQVFPTEQIVRDDDEYSELSLQEFDDDDDYDENYECIQVNSVYESYGDKDGGPPEDKYIVQYQYEGRTETELSLKEGTIVTLISQDNSDWWAVETENGQTGYFPANYLKKKTS